MNLNKNILQINNLDKIFSNGKGSVRALSGIKFSLKFGETLTLVGPSGCGKTTLLLILAGLEKPNSGELLFKDEVLHERNHKIALMLQNYGLFPWKTVRQNVELGLKIRNVKTSRKEIINALDELNISDKIDAFPQQLSGGQQQRVALARAMVLKPELLLLDEPFAALDTLTRERLQLLLYDTWIKNQFSMVLATHNIPEAVRLGQRIAIMSGNTGRIEKIIENPCGCKIASNGDRSFYEMTSLVRHELGSIT